MKNFTWTQLDPAKPLYYRMSGRQLRSSASGIEQYRLDVDNWMQEHSCGEWVHKYMVKFQHDEQALLFLLRWA